MPASLNTVHLIGNLTRDPELRVTPKGTSICQFSLAINRKFRSQSGPERSETTFVDVEAWGASGETIAKYCAKGQSLYVGGRLRLDQWEDRQTGAKRSKLSVVCESFQFLGGGAGADPAANAGHSASSEGHRTRQAPATPGNGAEMDEEPPF